MNSKATSAEFQATSTGFTRENAIEAYAAHGEVEADYRASYAYLLIAANRLGVTLGDDADEAYEQATDLAHEIAQADQA